MRPIDLLLCAIAAFSRAAAIPAGAADTPSRVQQLKEEAQALAPLVHTPLARDFLRMVPRLPHVEPRAVYRAFDVDDSPAARAMGHALGWDRGEDGMKLAQDLFATWSLFVRR